MLVIGTAGHIDHGKSSIVKRLTGTDPDRLPEEKKRGMTIDLGFAFFQTSENDTIAFVDVPGHERFVRNMVAGAGGIDAVMLVIAADDGWMPQSEEHFQIVRLLNVNSGLIVINKIDLADPDWLELLKQDINEKIAGTFLEGAPVFNVSARTGDGFEQLVSYLNELPSQLQSQKDIQKPRLYIDRSFVRPGIGGVVTGTLRGGKFSVGQAINIWPSLKEGKIRSLHSNNQEVETAVPGQRTAISFTGIGKEFLVRGGVITEQQNLTDLKERPVLALSVELIPGIAVSLVDRRRILVIVGTTEVEGEIRLYKEKELKAEQKGIVFFKPDVPVYALVGDHFIARLPTPMLTLGGGEILDRLRFFPRKKNIEQYQYLEQRLPFTLENLVLSELRKQVIVPMNEFLVTSDFSSQEIKNQVDLLTEKKMLKQFKGNIFHTTYFKETVDDFKKDLSCFLETNSHLKGLSLEQITKITGYDIHHTELIVKYLMSEGDIVRLRDKYDIRDRGIVLKGEIKNAYDRIINSLKESPYAPPALTKLAANGRMYREAIKYIIETGQGYKCGSEFIFLTEAWEEIVRFIKDKISDDGQLLVSDLKDKFGFSRKFAIPVLEETDRIKLTRRNGDVRIKGEHFENEEFNL